MGRFILSSFSLVFLLLIPSQGQRFPVEKQKAVLQKTTLKRFVSYFSSSATHNTDSMVKAEVEDVADMYTTIAKNASMTGHAVQIGMSPITPWRQWLTFSDSGMAIR
jgi:hypothetical protein